MVDRGGDIYGMNIEKLSVRVMSRNKERDAIGSTALLSPKKPERNVSYIPPKQ